MGIIRMAARPARRMLFRVAFNRRQALVETFGVSFWLVRRIGSRAGIRGKLKVEHGVQFDAVFGQAGLSMREIEEEDAGDIHLDRILQRTELSFRLGGDAMLACRSGLGDRISFD